MGEWIGFSGRAVMTCTSKGTRLNIQLTGLIPYGMYNVFLFGRQNEGDRPPWFGVVTSGPQWPMVFTANRRGNASATALILPGPLSVQGSIPKCLPDAFEHTLFLMYRMNGQITGGDPGPGDGRTPHVSFDLWEE
jgi:hypothetical protein